MVSGDQWLSSATKRETQNEKGYIRVSIHDDETLFSIRSRYDQVKVEKVVVFIDDSSLTSSVSSSSNICLLNILLNKRGSFMWMCRYLCKG